MKTARLWEKIRALVSGFLERGQRARGEREVQERQSEDTEEGPPSRRRHLRLGIDFGTAWSKLVLRDLDHRAGPCAFALRPDLASAGHRPGLDYCFPSIVASDNEKLLFGSEAMAWSGRGRATAAWASLKMRAAFPKEFYGVETEMPTGLDAQRLAALEVLDLLQRGHRVAENYCRRLRAKPALGMTLGIPMAYLDKSELRDLFVRIARLAFEMHRQGAPELRSGLGLIEARTLLRSAERAIEEKGPARDPSLWIRPEAAAALFWAFLSPQVAPGLYGALDIGAGTANSSFFRIVEEIVDGAPMKTRMCFYGAASRPPGMDAVDRVLAEVDGRSDPAAQRMRENELVEQHFLSIRQQLIEVANKVHSTYRSAFQASYPKEPRQSRWEGYRLFLFGGGSRFQHLRDFIERNRVWQNLAGDIELADPGLPDDLMEVGGGRLRADPSSLLVAYGLSFHPGDLPPFDRPGEVGELSYEQLAPRHREAIPWEDQ